MLLVANGAFKSGSTWLFNILQAMTGFPPPNRKYLNADWVNPSIHPDMLRALIDEADLTSHDFLVKNHFRDPKHRELLSRKSVVVFGIERDLRDVVVSAFFHYRLKNGYQKNFEEYYWTKGRFVANDVKQFNDLWRAHPGKAFIASYERLKSDFASECRAIGRFIGREVSDADIVRIRTGTSMESLREKYREHATTKEFFRKGIVGDWKNYLSQRMSADIDRIAAAGLTEPALVSKAKTKVYPVLERRFRR